MKTKLIMAVIVCSSQLFLHAQVPQLIHYQGRIVVAGTNFSGTGQFKFALIGTNQTGPAAAFWSNDGSSAAGAEPAAAVALSVTDGLYSILLGDATLPNMRVIPATVFTNADVRLRIWFGNGSGGFDQLSPDQRIAAVGYAMMAGTAATVADGAISAAKLADSSVTATKLADNAVTRSKLATGQVVKSLNALTDNVVLAPGANITLATNGNTLQIAATGGAAGGWSLSGNSGTTPDTQFIGTTDRTRLEFRANNQASLRLEPTVVTTSGPGGIQTTRPGTPNVIAGYSGNLASNGVVGAAIAGGGSAPSPLGSQENVIGGDYATIGGGLANRAPGDNATVPGGSQNTAAGKSSFAIGQRAKALHSGTFVWNDSTPADFASANSNQFLVRASGGVGINTTNLTGNFTLRSTYDFGSLMSFQNATGQEVASLDSFGNLTTKNQPFVKYVQGGREDFHNYAEDYPACTNFTICDLDVDAPSAGVLVIHGHVEFSGVARAGSGNCGPPDPSIPEMITDEISRTLEGVTKTLGELDKRLSDLADLVSKLPKPSSLVQANGVSANFFSSRADSYGRIGLGLFRLENATPVALSYSGREYWPDLFGWFGTLRLEVSWVLPVSEGQRTHLRLSGQGHCHRNKSDGIGVESFNLTATYFPKVQN